MIRYFSGLQRSTIPMYRQYRGGLTAITTTPKRAICENRSQPTANLVNDANVQATSPCDID